jgi:ABC-type lipoprotein release transport system permease subunit
VRHAVQAVHSISGDLGRAAAVLCAAAALTLALGMIFPVQYELDTSGYRHTAAIASAPLMAQPDEIDDVNAALDGAHSAVYIDYFTAVEANGRSVGNVSLWAVLGARVEAEATLMPDATRVAGEERDPADHGDWIDINADIASALGVHPGDTVHAYVWGDEPAPFTVRGVYAARDIASGGLATISAQALARLDPSIDLTSTAISTTATPAEVERMLNSEPWITRMDMYEPPIEAETVSEQLERAGDQASANLSLVLVVSVISLLALLALVVAEVTTLVSGFRSRADLLIDLGASPGALYRGLLVAVSAVTIGAVTLGTSVGVVAYSTGFAGPALPPTLVGPLWLAASLAGLAGILTVAVAIRIQRRKVLR